jgi:tetratricopeptide (TPR) repeat protein
MRIVTGCSFALLLLSFPGSLVWSQAAKDQPAQTASRVQSLGLSPDKASELQRMVTTHDYPGAEKLLLAEIAADPHSARGARLLDFIGAIYFMDHDDLHAAIAWKKSEAIAPLDPQLRFSLAMAYIRIGHSDWALGVLKSLAAQNKTQPIYFYWLGRLNYDAHLYSGAIVNFKEAIRLAPNMARAYDGLGLCYYFLNQNALAVENYTKAIELDRGSPYPSAWPYVDLATTLAFLNRTAEAEQNLRTAIQIDPQIPSAHFQMGNILEGKGEMEAAATEFREAAHLDPNYAEPHFALARLYRRMGQNSAAQEEVQAYMKIRDRSSGGALPAGSDHP